MPHAVTLPSGHVISDDRARIDMDHVVDRLAGAYWAADRPRAVTERSWANCLGFAVLDADGKQVGFARLLTDRALRAHLGDVFIDPDARGFGLGKALVAIILAHPELKTVTHWTLATSDAHGLYTAFGFRASPADPNWMTLTRAPG